MLSGAEVELRELRVSDAPSLFAMLTSDEVARFISPPPTTLEGFENFIVWTHRQRAVGAYACFAVTLKGHDTAIGLFQVRELEPAFATAEWGFAIGSAFWGRACSPPAPNWSSSSCSARSASIASRRARRSETAAATAALRKIGAVQEGLLRKSFLRNGEYLDQALYAIVSDDWRAARDERTGAPTSLRVH